MKSSRCIGQGTHSVCCSSKEAVEHTGLKPINSYLLRSGRRCHDHEPEEGGQSAEVGREHDGNDTAGADRELIILLDMIDFIGRDTILTSGLSVMDSGCRRTAYAACGIKVIPPITLPCSGREKRAGDDDCKHSVFLGPTPIQGIV